MRPRAGGVRDTLDRVIAGVVSPSHLTPAELHLLWTHAEEDGGAELLAAVMTGCPGLAGLSVRERAAARLRAAAIDEMIRRRELCRLAGAFDVAGIRMLLIKGAGLAYTVYPAAHLRPACDVDLFIADADIEAAERTLVSIGYAHLDEPDARSASMQRHYARPGRHGARHFVDLHWRIANRHVFAGALRFEEAWRGSHQVGRLCPAARTLDTADALLLACVHRVAHHDDEDDRVWLWDVHLLAQAMGVDDADALAARAASSGMRAVVAHGLARARDRFGTAVDARLLARLREPGIEEPSARFIGGGARQIDLVWSDLAAVPTMRQRARLLREHLFPDRVYMRAKYERWPRRLLPLAYVDRIARGAGKWFRKSSAGTRV